jgi:hypothetical protein
MPLHGNGKFLKKLLHPAAVPRDLIRPTAMLVQQLCCRGHDSMIHSARPRAHQDLAQVHIQVLQLAPACPPPVQVQREAGA